eukprot:CAMPEP_0116032608 /NCGR_PEP_ID=MMETSP0321-20121206/18278_1 /TAXON_ID=163516 /ORGANISM="Leptocylindrus danicus var. danicus, Strain B650" /LENGTH=408 /DNA_ID=CAMNT_0003508091 /DNA_START=57 /DNA_END=1280 /DNA_ORIENTATION=-
MSSKPEITKVAFPVFGIAWHTHINGTSILAHCGGGGSARSGIGNSIVITHYTPDSQAYMRLTIDTMDQICVGVAIGASFLGHNVDRNQFDPDVVVIAAVGNEIRLYSAFTGRLLSKEHTLEAEKAGVNCVAMSADGTMVLCGCESGRVLSYKLQGLPQPDPNGEEKKGEDGDGDGEGPNTQEEKEEEVYAVTELIKLAEMVSHEKAVCCVCFRPGEVASCISSAKDGSCREWDARTGKMLAVMQCSAGPPPAQRGGRKIPHQILVRGCAYSPGGDFVYTCASGRRGKAFLGKWKRMKPDPAKKMPAFLPVENCCVAECPVSAMSMSGDGTMAALGSVEGNISFIGLEGMNLIRTFSVHDLPVTCITARPTPLNWAPLKNMKNLTIDAVSASADNKIALISTQSRRMTW